MMLRTSLYRLVAFAALATTLCNAETPATRQLDCGWGPCKPEPMQDETVAEITIAFTQLDEMGREKISRLLAKFRQTPDEDMSPQQMLEDLYALGTELFDDSEENHGQISLWLRGDFPNEQEQA